MILEVMCRIGDGPLRPGELEVTQTAGGPLVTWSVDTRDVLEARDRQGSDLAIELHLPGDTVWAGEVYLADVGLDHQVPQQPLEEFPVKVRLHGTGVLRENSIAVHADALVQRINAILGKDQR
ncbi:MAG TPA: hypothetical protein VE645_01915 [Pseudonocardiaceae bacterium]|jgi:hypothetical protein|nr:hypothetical protein [Pseudonocardiaceae bacterium]